MRDRAQIERDEMTIVQLPLQTGSSEESRRFAREFCEAYDPDRIYLTPYPPLADPDEILPDDLVRWPK